MNLLIFYLCKYTILFKINYIVNKIFNMAKIKVIEIGI